MPEIEEEILTYNFRTIDIEKIDIENISEDNRLKLVFKIAKSLLETKATDEEIYEVKIRSEDLLILLNEYRRYINRIAHVYKKPSTEEVIEFVKKNRDKIDAVLRIMVKMYKE